MYVFRVSCMGDYDDDQVLFKACKFQYWKLNFSKRAITSQVLVGSRSIMHRILKLRCRSIASSDEPYLKSCNICTPLCEEVCVTHCIPGKFLEIFLRRWKFSVNFWKFSYRKFSKILWNIWIETSSLCTGDLPGNLA